MCACMFVGVSIVIVSLCVWIMACVCVCAPMFSVNQVKASVESNGSDLLSLVLRCPQWECGVTLTVGVCGCAAILLGTRTSLNLGCIHHTANHRHTGPVLTLPHLQKVSTHTFHVLVTELNQLTFMSRLDWLVLVLWTQR